MNYRVILLLSVLSFCFLSAAAEFSINSTATLQQGNSNITGAITVEFGAILGLSIFNKYDPLHYPSNPGPFCYLEVSALPGFNSADYWTKPCPRTPQVQYSGLSFWCRCNFTLDGNLVLTSGDNTTSYENGKVLWSSNTAGLGVQSMAVFNSTDAAGQGNTLVLYNANMEIVWGNIANNTAGEDYSCTDAAPSPTPARKLLRLY